nr:unnamed protein product [Callosobruchus analis]
MFTVDQRNHKRWSSHSR